MAGLKSIQSVGDKATAEINTLRHYQPHRKTITDFLHRSFFEPNSLDVQSSDFRFILFRRLRYITLPGYLIGINFTVLWESLLLQAGLRSSFPAAVDLNQRRHAKRVSPRPNPQARHCLPIAAPPSDRPFSPSGSKRTTYR
jgi:hypothetical protein